MLNALQLKPKTIVPESDVSYIHKSTRPCKNLRIRYDLIGEAAERYGVEGYCFGFPDTRDSKKTISSKFGNRIRWMESPGAWNRILLGANKWDLIF